MKAEDNRLRDDLDDFGRAILDAARSDEPPPDARDAMLMIVAAHLGSGSTAPLDATSGTQGVTGGRGTGSSMTSEVITGALWKVAAGIVLVSVAVAVPYLALRDRAPAVSATPAPPVACALPTASALSAGSPPTRAMPPPSLPRPSPLPNAPLGPTAVGSPTTRAQLPLPRATRPDVSPVAAGLLEETALLDRGRQALRSGAAREAMRLLDVYDQKFPRGELRTEAESLRTRAAATSESNHDQCDGDATCKMPR